MSQSSASPDATRFPELAAARAGLDAALKSLGAIEHRLTRIAPPSSDPVERLAQAMRDHEALTGTCTAEDLYRAGFTVAQIAEYWHEAARRCQSRAERVLEPDEAARCEADRREDRAWSAFAAARREFDRTPSPAAARMAAERFRAWMRFVAPDQADALAGPLHGRLLDRIPAIAEAAE